MGTPARAAHGRHRGGAYSCSWGGCVRLLLDGGCVRLLLWGRACLAPPGCVPLPSVGGAYRLLGGTYRSCQFLVAAYWLRARPTDGRGGPAWQRCRLSLPQRCGAGLLWRWVWGRVDQLGGGGACRCSVGAAWDGRDAAHGRGGGPTG